MTANIVLDYDGGITEIENGLESIVETQFNTLFDVFFLMNQFDIVVLRLILCLSQNSYNLLKIPDFFIGVQYVSTRFAPLTSLQARGVIKFVSNREVKWEDGRGCCLFVEPLVSPVINYDIFNEDNKTNNIDNSLNDFLNNITHSPNNESSKSSSIYTKYKKKERNFCHKWANVWSCEFLMEQTGASRVGICTAEWKKLSDGNDTVEEPREGAYLGSDKNSCGFTDWGEIYQGGERRTKDMYVEKRWEENQSGKRVTSSVWRNGSWETITDSMIQLRIRLKLDLRKEKQRLSFFVQDKKQPFFVSGVPINKPLQFAVNGYFGGECVKLAYMGRERDSSLITEGKEVKVKETYKYLANAIIMQKKQKYELKWI